MSAWNDHFFLARGAGPMQRVVQCVAVCFSMVQQYTVYCSECVALDHAEIDDFRKVSDSERIWILRFPHVLSVRVCVCVFLCVCGSALQIRGAGPRCHFPDDCALKCICVLGRHACSSTVHKKFGESVLSKTAIFPDQRRPSSLNQGKGICTFPTNLHMVGCSTRPTSRWASKAHRMTDKTQ